MPESSLILFLSKLLPLLVYPVGLSLTLMTLAGAGALLGRRRLPNLALAGAVGVLWLSAMPVFATWAIGTLERQFPARSIADTPKADVAIILGGAIGQPLAPRVTLDLGDGADRVWHAARLYRSGTVKRVLVAGGNIPWMPTVKPEAQLIRELLMEWGVPDTAISIAGGSRNTFENALEIKNLRRQTGFSSGLLITSAFHMPRAMAVFRRAGVPVTAASVDVRAVHKRQTDVLDWLPDAGALLTTTSAIKEWIGYFVYRLRGFA